jgi:hypothetical protein
MEELIFFLEYLMLLLFVTKDEREFILFLSYIQVSALGFCLVILLKVFLFKWKVQFVEEITIIITK